MKEIPSFPVDKTIIIPWNIGLRSLRGRKSRPVEVAVAAEIPRIPQPGSFFGPKKGQQGRSFPARRNFLCQPLPLNGSRDPASAETGEPSDANSFANQPCNKAPPFLPPSFATESQENGSTRLSTWQLNRTLHHGSRWWISSLSFSEFQYIRACVPLITITLPPRYDKYLATLRRDRKKVSSSL